MNGDDGELSKEGSRRFHEAIRGGKAKVKFMTRTPPTDADVRRLMDLLRESGRGEAPWYTSVSGPLSLAVGEHLYAICEELLRLREDLEKSKSSTFNNAATFARINTENAQLRIDLADAEARMAASGIGRDGQGNAGA